MILEKEIDGYLFSSDKSKLQIEVICNYLSKESYWAQNIPLEIGDVVEYQSRFFEIDSIVENQNV